MKPLILTCLFISILLYCKSQTPLVSQSLEQKPALFSNLPNKIIISNTWLDKFFTNSSGDSISFTISSLLNIKGIVLEKVKIGEQQESINIRCSNYSNALLNISRLYMGKGKLVKYTARILSPAHGDVYALTEENGQYYFYKQQQLLSMVQ